MRKIIKRIISVICVVALFIGCGKGLRYILIDDTDEQYYFTKLKINQLYNSPQNIDILFVGSSHAYLSLVPEIADEIFGAYTFNIGSNRQSLDGSLAMIKETIKYNDVSHIYLEMYYEFIDVGSYENRTDLDKIYYISDYMKPSLQKIQYLLNASSKKYYIGSFIPARRRWEKLFDFNYIKRVVSKKQEDVYKNCQWKMVLDERRNYIDRGFVTSTKEVSQESCWNSKAYQEIGVAKSITDDCDWRMSLQDIIDICKKNEIELTLFMTPMPEWTLVGTGGTFDDYHNVIQKISNENEIKYYDFNFCKSKYFDANERKYFPDSDHLNANGAEVFTKLFANFFTGKIDEKDLFYNSYAEKLADESPIIYGLAGPIDDKNKGLKYGRIISNRNEGIEYKIIMTPEKGEQRVLQDFDENKDFTFPIDEHGIINVVWRLSDKIDDVKSIEFTY